MSHTNSKRERKKDRKKNTQAVLQYAGEVEDGEIISDGSASYNDTEFPIATPEKNRSSCQESSSYRKNRQQKRWHYPTKCG